MRRVGVVSDIHANLPALEAALRALESAAVDTIVCCGDIIGIGLWPRECVARIRASADLCVLGNHESALLRGSNDRQLALAARLLGEEDFSYLAGLSETATLGALALVHGSFRAPMVEFLVDSATASASFASFEARIGLHGHTHTQSLFVRHRDITEPSAIALGVPYTIERDSRVLVNPGSVGEDKSGASYALLDLADETVVFSRAGYEPPPATDRSQEIEVVLSSASSTARQPNGRIDGSR